MATRNSSEQQHQPKWTPFLTTLLANLIVNQVLKGNKVSISFSNKTWNFITDEFNIRSGFKFDKENLKNRFAVLRRQYAVVKRLLSQKDFTLDESNGSIIANDQSWEQYLKEYPDAEDIRSCGCPIYNQLSQIFAEDETEEETIIWPPAQASTAVSPPSKKRRSRGVEASIANAIYKMADASKLQTNALTEIRERFSLAECIRVLDRIGLAENLYFEALEIFSNPSARETFLSLKRDKRLAWIQWKCNSVSMKSL